MRTGVIAKKVGMTRLFQEDGRHVPVTVLSLDNLQVVARRESDRDGYTAVQLGAGSAKAKNLSKPQRGHFGKAEVEPKAKVVEFRVAEDALLDVGTEITADHFVAGQMVDVQGVTKGRGFAGAMKRHGFAGLPASHGASDKQRSPGSLASRRALGRVVPGQRMAGHHGATTTSTIKIEVVQVDAEKSLIYVMGAVPGPRGGLVTVSETYMSKKVRAEAKAPTIRKDKMGNIIKAPVSPKAKK